MSDSNRLSGEDLEVWVRDRLERVNQIRVTNGKEAYTQEQAVVVYGYFSKSDRDDLEAALLSGSLSGVERSPDKPVDLECDPHCPAYPDGHCEHWHEGGKCCRCNQE